MKSERKKPCAASVRGSFGEQRKEFMVIEDVCINGKTVWKPVFLKIPYDNQRVVRDIRESGLLDSAPWFVNSTIQILLTGTDRSSQLVGLANQLAKEAGEQGFADEKYWEEAAQ